MQRNLLQGPVVPHLGFSEQSPVLERTKGGDLAAQGFHRAIASEVLHFWPPTGLPAEYLIPILRQRHYDSSSAPAHDFPRGIEYQTPNRSRAAFLAIGALGLLRRWIGLYMGSGLYSTDHRREILFEADEVFPAE
jgi:hypothetical protein